MITSFNFLMATYCCPVVSNECAPLQFPNGLTIKVHFSCCNWIGYPLGGLPFSEVVIQTHSNKCLCVFGWWGKREGKGDSIEGFGNRRGNGIPHFLHPIDQTLLQCLTAKKNVSQLCAHQAQRTVCRISSQMSIYKKYIPILDNGDKEVPHLASSSWRPRKVLV